MKYRELLADLSAAGCFFVRHGGNHDIWYSPITGKKFPVPRHGTGKEVPAITEKMIRREAGVL